MDILQQQSVLARVLTDDTLRDVVFRDAETSCLRDDISPVSVAYLRSIGVARLDLVAELLKHKRIDKIKQMLPYTTSLLADELSRIFRRYFRDNPPRTLSFLEEAKTFARFLHSCEVRNTFAYPYIEEIVRFELDRRNISQSTKCKTCLLPCCVEEFQIEHRLVEESVLQSCAHLLVDSFSYDIRKIINTLDQQQSPPKLERQPTLLLFQKIPNELTVRVTKINEVTKVLLERCNGKCSFQEVTEELCRRFKVIEGRLREHFVLQLRQVVVTLWQQQAINISEHAHLAIP